MSSFPLRRSARIAAKAIARELATTDARRASPPVEPLIRRSTRLAAKAAARDLVENRYSPLNKREQCDLAVSNLTPAKMREINQSAEWLRYLLNEMEASDMPTRQLLFIDYMDELMRDHRLVLAAIAKFRKTIDYKLLDILQSCNTWTNTSRAVVERMNSLPKEFRNYCNDLKSHSSYRSESDIPYPWNAEVSPVTRSILYRNMLNGATQTVRPPLNRY